MTPRIFAAALLAALTLSATAHADAGSPDPHFGTDGVQQLDTTGNQSESGVAVQADGKLIVLNRGTNNAFALIHRLNENGSIDNGFGTVTVDVAAAVARRRCARLDPSPQGKPDRALRPSGPRAQAARGTRPRRHPAHAQSEPYRAGHGG